MPPGTVAALEHFRFDGESCGKYQLPEYLDAIGHLFPRLLHVTVTNSSRPLSGGGEVADEGIAGGTGEGQGFEILDALDGSCAY